MKTLFHLEIHEHPDYEASHRISSVFAIASAALALLITCVAGASAHPLLRLGTAHVSQMHGAPRQRMSPDNMIFHYDFPQDGHLGAGPDAGVIDLNGQLYGTTFGGGTNGCGTIFDIDSFALLTEHVDNNFCQTSPDGWGPVASVTRHGSWLYGTLSGGGVGGGSGSGGVFRKRTLPMSYNFYPFDGVNEIGSSAPVLPYQGRYYGESPRGGGPDAGAVWYLQGNTITTCYSFSGFDGTFPSGGLIQKNGYLYGVTLAGGQNNSGTIFKLDPTKCGTQSNPMVWRYDFGSSPYGANDGAGPHALVEVGSLLYGATSGGGSHQAGTVFSIGSSGPSTYQQRYAFDPSAQNGTMPWAGMLLTEGPPRYLWGTTAWGGLGSCSQGTLTGCGTIFKYKLPSGPLTTEWNFHGYDGQNPYSTLVLDANGLFYGTTYLGGSGGNGTVFGLLLCSGNQC